MYSLSVSTNKFATLAALATCGPRRSTAIMASMSIVVWQSMAIMVRRSIDRHTMIRNLSCAHTKTSKRGADAEEDVAEEASVLWERGVWLESPLWAAAAVGRSPLPRSAS